MFNYTPQEVKNAAVGDIIGLQGPPRYAITFSYLPSFSEFRFYPGGHTVVRAEFGHPCIPYSYTGANKVGFYSGLKSPQVISDNVSFLSDGLVDLTH